MQPPLPLKFNIIVVSVKKNPGPPVPQLDPVQRKLERIASKQASPYREPSYRDRNFRERGGDRGPERDDMHRFENLYRIN